MTVHPTVKVNGPESIAARYSSIVAGLSETDIAAVWAATMFGRKPVDERLRDRVERLEALRDEIGAHSAARSRNGRSDAA